MVTVPTAVARVTRAGTRAMCFGAVREARSLHLYANDAEPGDDGGRLREVAGGGYAPVSLAVEDWTLRDAPGQVVATYPERVWRFTDAVGAVYGYYVAGAGGTVLWAERFRPDALLVRGPGDEIRLTLELALEHPA